MASVFVWFLQFVIFKKQSPPKVFFSFIQASLDYKAANKDKTAEIMQVVFWPHSGPKL